MYFDCNERVAATQRKHGQVDFGAVVAPRRVFAKKIITIVTMLRESIVAFVLERPTPGALAVRFEFGAP